MVVVKKPQSNNLRICIDPRDLNQALQRPRYPQSKTDDILLQLSKAKVFLALDAKDRFWQVKLLLNSILVPLWKIEVVKNAIWNQHSTRRISKKTN